MSYISMKLLGETSLLVTIPIKNSTDQVRHYHRRAPPSLGFTYQYKPKRMHAEGPKPEDVSLWFDNQDINSSEAACARLNNFSRCTTRINPKNNILSMGKKSNEVEDLPNILLILLDPMSKSHFERSMPKTAAMLETMGFIPFSNYSVVGRNSGPNQAALYSGMRLVDRYGIKKNIGQNNKWLWDRLRDDGYITLKVNLILLHSVTSFQCLSDFLKTLT